MSLDNTGRRLATALNAKPPVPEDITLERLTARAMLQTSLHEKRAILKQAAALGHKRGDHEWAKGVEYAIGILHTYAEP